MMRCHSTRLVRPHSDYNIKFYYNLLNIFLNVLIEYHSVPYTKYYTIIIYRRRRPFDIFFILHFYIIVSTYVFLLITVCGS